MRKILSLLIFVSISAFSQEKEDYRVIPSLTDWIEEINSWPDSAYEVRKVRIVIDLEKDSLLYGEQFKEGQDTTKIQAGVNKPITIEDFHIDGYFSGRSIAIKNIRFKEEVRLKNYRTRMISFNNVVFEKNIYISGSDDYVYYNSISCTYKESLGFYDLVDSKIHLIDPVIYDRLFFVRTAGMPNLDVKKAQIKRLSIWGNKFSELSIRNSKIEELSLHNSKFESSAHIVDSEMDSIDVSGAQLPKTNTYFTFDQISGKLYSQPIFGNPKFSVSDSMDFTLSEEYDQLIGSYKLLLDGYQNRGDYDSYNACFVEMKNIETRRLAFRYNENPTFNGYFTWKINQFLKLFSAYGTEPARAVIVSLYVILGFALVYLFFPNHWDSHGRTRIMDRLRFFLKYSKQEEGVREVYLDEKKEELVPFEEFRAYFDEHGQKAPRFFYAIAIPLYKWSVSGTRMVSGLLSQVDVLGGTWENTPPSTRWLKSSLVIGAFLTALIYDLFVKVLNAIMLSINTFTTLGFGEIPIKGLPRYLAIIQGFIGWFMLTIFSVSLIAQLLN